MKFEQVRLNLDFPYKYLSLYMYICVCLKIFNTTELLSVNTVFKCPFEY